MEPGEQPSSNAPSYRCTTCDRAYNEPPDHLTCPHCGGGVSMHFAADPEPATPIGPDTPCLRCGYSLEGLNQNAICPECGTPASQSLQRNLLKFSDPTYVKNLHRGAILAQASIIILIIASITTVGMQATGTASRGTITLFGNASSTVTSVISLIGWWLLSMPDPAFIGRDPAGKSRIILRVTLVIVATSLVASLLGYLLGNTSLVAPGSISRNTPATPLIRIAEAAASIAFIVKIFATLAYVRAIARRIPSVRLTRRANTIQIALVAFLIAILLTATLIVLALVGVHGGASGVPLGFISMAFGCGSFLFGLAVLLLWVSMLDMLRSRLKAVREQNARTP